MAAQNPFNSKFQQDPANIAFSFLKLQELIRFSNASKKARQLALQALPKTTAREMLHLVLNPEENNVKKLKEMIQKSLLKQENNMVGADPCVLPDKKQNVENISILSCPVLIRTQGREEYVTEHEIIINADGTKQERKLKEKQKVVKRSWKNISPLEAAAWSGDNFLVNELLKCVPKHFYIEAISQLQRVLKEKLEHGEYLASFKALIQSYNEYIKAYQEQEQKPPMNWNMLDKMWVEKVGLSQNNLSTYGLQEFCDKKPHVPLPLFDKEPSRVCKFYDDSIVDLSLIGSFYSLYKGERAGGAVRRGDLGRGGCGVAFVALHDLAAINRLCEVQTKELNDIIELLVSTLKQEEELSQSDVNARSTKLCIML